MPFSKNSYANSDTPLAAVKAALTSASGYPIEIRLFITSCDNSGATGGTAGVLDGAGAAAAGAAGRGAAAFKKTLNIQIIRVKIIA
jgi:hypothetical protein